MRRGSECPRSVAGSAVQAANRHRYRWVPPPPRPSSVLGKRSRARLCRSPYRPVHVGSRGPGSLAPSTAGAHRPEIALHFGPSGAATRRAAPQGRMGAALPAPPHPAPRHRPRPTARFRRPQRYLTVPSPCWCAVPQGLPFQRQAQTPVCMLLPWQGAPWYSPAGHPPLRRSVACCALSPAALPPEACRVQLPKHVWAYPTGPLAFLCLTAVSPHEYCWQEVAPGCWYPCSCGCSRPEAAQTATSGDPLGTVSAHLLGISQSVRVLLQACLGRQGTSAEHRFQAA